MYSMVISIVSCDNVNVNLKELKWQFEYQMNKTYFAKCFENDTLFDIFNKYMSLAQKNTNIQFVADGLLSYDETNDYQQFHIECISDSLVVNYTDWYKSFRKTDYYYFTELVNHFKGTTVDTMSLLSKYYSDSDFFVYENIQSGEVSLERLEMNNTISRSINEPYILKCDVCDSLFRENEEFCLTDKGTCCHVKCAQSKRIKFVSIINSN